MSQNLTFKVLLSLFCLIGLYPNNSTAQGNILFQENYDGNNITDPRFRTTGLGTNSSYTWYPGPGANPIQYCANSFLPYFAEYTIYKYATRTSTCETWIYPNFVYKDHTNAHSATEALNEIQGNFFIIDAGPEAGQFYEFSMNNLCPGNRLEFSLWAMNINPKSHKDVSDNYLYPNLSFRIFDASTDTLIHTYSTGNIPIDDEFPSSPNYSPTPIWHQYATEFNLPLGVNSVKVKVVNNASGGTEGNDFALDDIELRLMGPTPASTQQSVVRPCVDSQNLVLNGDFTNLYLFPNTTIPQPVITASTIYYKWEYNATGNVNGVWDNLTSGNTPNITSQQYQFPYVISNVTTLNNGYYRLKIGSDPNLNDNCSFTSNIIRIIVNEPQISNLTMMLGNSTVICDSALIMIVPEGTYSSPVTYSVNSFLPASANAPYLLRQEGDTAYYKAVGTENINFNMIDNANCPTSNTLNVAIQCNGALPIYLTQFAGRKNANQIDLTWEIDDHHIYEQFEIERSINGKNYNSLGIINRQTNNIKNNQSEKYNFIDITPLNGDNYYRLKLISTTGFEYSKTINLKLNELSDEIIITPNPATNFIYINNVEIKKIELFNIVGKSISTIASTDHSKIDITALEPGTYYLKILTKNGSEITKSFIKY